MYKKNTLNNIILGNKRKDPVYQAVLTDLALAGAIDIKIAEALLGYQIPDYLKLPADFEARLHESDEPVEDGTDDESDEPVEDGTDDGSDGLVEDNVSDTGNTSDDTTEGEPVEEGSDDMPDGTVEEDAEKKSGFKGLFGRKA